MRIDPIHREDEAGLILSRWFDYGLMHPTQATYCYAWHYQQQTEVFAATFVDIESAPEARGFDHEDVFESRDRTSMWLARRSADRLGVPYDFAIAFARERAVRQLHRMMPRPNQLYSEELELDLTDAWRERVGTQITYSRLPAVNARARDTPLRRRHAAFVVDQIRARHPSSWPALLGRLYTEGILCTEQVIDRFPMSVLGEATRTARQLSSRSGLSHR